MNIQKTIALFLLVLVHPYISAENKTTPFKQVDCRKYNLPSTEHCSEGPRLYASPTSGLTTVDNSYTNKSTADRVMFAEDPFGAKGYDVKFEVLQGDENVNFYSDWLFTPSPQLNWYKINMKGKDYVYTIFKKGEITTFTQNKQGTSLRFLKADKTLDRNKPILKLIFRTTTYGINKERKINGKDKNVIYHHAFFYGSWCGDGVVDREFGEEFDDGTNSDKAGAYLVNNCKNPPSKNSN